MNQTNAQNINEYEDLTRYADENFDTNEVDLFQFAGVDSSPLTRLKSVMLSLDWEITDEYLQELAEELAGLTPHWEDDKVATLYLQGMGKIGKYLRLRGAHAHPNAIKLLLSYFYDFEQIVSSPDMSGERINKMVQNDLRKFKVLQYQIKLAEEDETETAKGLEGGRQTGKAGEALRQFKAAMLELDWEVTDESLNRFIEALKVLGEAETGNKAALLLIHGMQALGQYIAEERAHAHPDVFNLLHAFRDGVEQILDKGPNALDQQQKKNILVDRINRLNHLKSLIAPPDAQAAAARPEPVAPAAPEPVAAPEPAPAPREEEAPAAVFTPGPADDDEDDEDFGPIGAGPASLSDGPAALSPVDDDDDEGLVLTESDLEPVATLTATEEEMLGSEDIDDLPEYEEAPRPAGDPNVFELDAVPRQTAVATAQEEYTGPFEVVDETDGMLSLDADDLPAHSMKLTEDEEALLAYDQAPRQTAAGHESWAREEGQFDLFGDDGESHDDLDLDREQVPLAVEVPQDRESDDGLGGILDDDAAPIVAFDDALDDSEIMNLEDMDEEAPAVADPVGVVASPEDVASIEGEIDDIFSDAGPANSAKSAMMTSDEKYPEEELPGPAVHSVDDASDIFRDSTVGDAHSVAPALNGFGEDVVEGLPGGEVAALSPDDDMQAELSDKLDSFFTFEEGDGPAEAPPPQSETVATPVVAAIDDDDESDLFAPTTKDDVLPSALAGVEAPQDDEVFAQDDAELTGKLDDFFGSSEEEAPAPPVGTVAAGEDELFVVEEEAGPGPAAQTEPVSALSDADLPEDGPLFAEEDQELNAELDDFFVTPADEDSHAEAATDALLAETSVSPVAPAAPSALDGADVPEDGVLLTEEDKELEADLDNFFNLSSDAGEGETPVAASAEPTPPEPTPAGDDALFIDEAELFADGTPAETPASDAAPVSALDAEEAPEEASLFAEEDQELNADLDAFFNQSGEDEREAPAAPSAAPVVEESAGPLFADDEPLFADTPSPASEQAEATPDETGLFAEDELTFSTDATLDVPTETPETAEADLFASEVPEAPVDDALETLAFDDGAVLATPAEEAPTESLFADEEGALAAAADGPVVADGGGEEPLLQDEPAAAPVQETPAVSPAFDDSVVAALADVKATEKSSSAASREKTDPVFQNQLDSFFDLPSDPEYAEDEEPLLADDVPLAAGTGEAGALFDESALTPDAEEEAAGGDLFAPALEETADVVATPVEESAEPAFDSDVFASALEETVDVAASTDEAAELAFEPDAPGSDEAPTAGDELFASALDDALDETTDAVAATAEDAGAAPFAEEIAEAAPSEDLFAETPEPESVSGDVSGDGDELFASALEEAAEKPFAEDDLFGPSGDDATLTLDADDADDSQGAALVDALSDENEVASMADLSLETPKTPAPGLDELAEGGEAGDIFQGHNIEEIPDEELAFTEEEKAPEAAAERILADEVLLQPEDSLSEPAAVEAETPDESALAEDGLFADDDASLGAAIEEAEEAPGELFADVDSPAAEGEAEPGELFADLDAPAAESEAEPGELFADMDTPAAEGEAESADVLSAGDLFGADEEANLFGDADVVAPGTPAAEPAAVAETGRSFGEAIGGGIDALGAALPALLTRFSDEHLGQARRQLRELRESESLSPVQTAAAGMLDTVLSGLPGRAGRAESDDTAAVVESLYNSLAEPKEHLSLETVTAYTQWVQSLIAGQAEPRESAAAPLSAGELHRELDEFRSSIREELAQIREALQKH